jgi:hypothetical protein
VSISTGGCARSSLPNGEEESLPRGYLRLDTVDVHGDQANLAFWTGPVPKAKPGTVLLDCGTGYTYQLTRGAGGKWKVANAGMSQC